MLTPSVEESMHRGLTAGLLTGLSFVRDLYPYLVKQGCTCTLLPSIANTLGRSLFCIDLFMSLKTSVGRFSRAFPIACAVKELLSSFKMCSNHRRLRDAAHSAANTDAVLILRFRCCHIVSVVFIMLNTLVYIVFGSWMYITVCICDVCQTKYYLKFLIP